MSYGPIIWIEGGIGAGKTTLTEKMAKALNLRAIYEPVEGNPYLARFYEEPKRWAFPMQIESRPGGDDVPHNNILLKSTEMIHFSKSGSLG